MATKYKVILTILALATAFATGRYTVPTKVVTEIKTVEVDKKDQHQDQKQDDHKKTTIVEAPDGTKTTTVTDDSSTDTKTDTKTVDSSSSDTYKSVTKESAVTVMGLVGANASFSDLGTPVYGLSVTKPVLGPITIGVWGLSSKVGGLAVGLTF